MLFPETVERIVDCMFDLVPAVFPDLVAGVVPGLPLVFLRMTLALNKLAITSIYGGITIDKGNMLHYRNID